MDRLDGEDHSVKKYVAVVSLFIIAASLLVVLTTLAINMLTATGDLNRLLVKWSQNESDKDSLMISYQQTGNLEYLRSYHSSQYENNQAERVIDELMQDHPRADFIFPAFDSDKIHPSEINGLIRIFTFFSGTEQVKNLKATWQEIKRLQSEKRNAVESFLNTEEATRSVLNSQAEQILMIDREINTKTRQMILGNAQILLMLKRYSLWFTVLLGILIVLIGVIYTVRGIKQIHKAEALLQERDYLALFPELNQYPVFNISEDGDLGFVNQSSRRLFPDLVEKGLDHPFLKNMKKEFHNLDEKWGSTAIREIHIEDRFFQQAINFISKEKGIHLHSIDITPLKEEQQKLSRSLEEKNILLAEIHHRVKNNMAVISSLLQLQEMLGEKPETALEESRSRIQSMSIVHELLYQSDSFSEIDPELYINKLADHLQRSFTKFQTVQAEMLDDDNASININLAVPLGLLINEIGYYMFNLIPKNRSNLDIKISMRQEGDLYCIELQSKQLKSEYDLNKTGSGLRMKLIDKLLQQIDGELKHPESKHYRIQIICNSKIERGSNSVYL